MGFFQNWFGKKATARTAQPEYLYHVTVTPDAVRVTHPKRAPESIRWDQVEQILLINTDERPFLPDVWLVLKGTETGCTLPQGCPGWHSVYDIVSRYDGFNFENVIRSAGCTENAVFELWHCPAGI